MASANGGAATVSALGQAAAAIQSGLVERVLCVAASATFVENHNGVEPRDVRDHEVPYGLMGANSGIALVMRRHMHQYGTTLDALGNIAVTARYHASLNPNSYLKKPLTLEDYKTSRMVADPVRLLDCVMPANGGKAFILTSAEKAATMPRKPVYLMGYGEQDNPSYGPRTHSDATIMGIKDAGARAFDMAGATPADMDFAELYDDYVVIELMQIEDLGILRQGRHEILRVHRLLVQGEAAHPDRRRHDQLRAAVHRRRHDPYPGGRHPTAGRRRRSGRWPTRAPASSPASAAFPTARTSAPPPWPS